MKVPLTHFYTGLLCFTPIFKIPLAHANVPYTRVERTVVCFTPIFKIPLAHTNMPYTRVERNTVCATPLIKTYPRAHESALHTRRTQGRVRYPSRVRVKKNGWCEGGGVEGAGV